MEELMLCDDFMDDRSAGSVIGTLSASGHKRLGVDVEKVLGIDNGALRIAPLIEAGFGRAVLSYGPFPRREGLAYAVAILNGHNTSQYESLPDTFRERITLWLKGSEIDPKLERLVMWLRSRRVLRTLRQFRGWKRTAKDSNPVPLLDENLAVGWFPSPNVKDPRQEGSSFIMHALGPENGEIWTGGNGTRTRSLRGVQNLPLYLVSIVRPGGVIYYISSIDGAIGSGAYPMFRPLGVEHNPVPKELYFGIQQSVLGQIGFRLDTRVRWVRVSHAKGYESWFGGAHAADYLKGDGNLDGSIAEAGGTWRVLRGEAQRNFGGVTGSVAETIAILDPGLPAGLIHADTVMGYDASAKVGLIWRFLDDRNHWRLEVGAGESVMVLVSKGERHVLASKTFPVLEENRKMRLQVLDDGNRMMAYVDGEPLLEGYVMDTRLEESTGVGIFLNNETARGMATVSSFEAHPRAVDMPDALFGEGPWYRKGKRIVVSDDFSGKAQDLEGRMITVGGQRWKRLIGSGVIETTGDGSARIRGSVEDPCSGRTAYCLDWKTPDFADLEAIIIPPGTDRGQRQRSIAGFILYQDRNNYVTLNVWRADYYGGASISTFFKFGGFEDIYDAIWTNVGDRVFYGRPSRLRVCCDGERYLVFVNEEPVLYRAFRDVYPDWERLRIRKIGLLANWEFGNDTGSRFEEFCARY